VKQGMAKLRGRLKARAKVKASKGLAVPPAFKR